MGPFYLAGWKSKRAAAAAAARIDIDRSSEHVLVEDENEKEALEEKEIALVYRFDPNNTGQPCSPMLSSFVLLRSSAASSLMVAINSPLPSPVM